MNREQALGVFAGLAAFVRPNSYNQLGFPPVPHTAQQAIIRMYSDSSKDRQTLLSMGFPLDRVECTCRLPDSRCVELLTQDPRGD